MIFLINSKMLFCWPLLSSARYSYKRINKSGTRFCIRLQEILFFFIILLKLKHHIEELGEKGGLFSIEYCVVFFVGQVFIRIHQQELERGQKSSPFSSVIPPWLHHKSHFNFISIRPRILGLHYSGPKDILRSKADTDRMPF